jgi:hypothetical protein
LGGSPQGVSEKTRGILLNHYAQNTNMRPRSSWTVLQARLGWVLDFVAIGGVVAVIAVIATVLS